MLMRNGLAREHHRRRTVGKHACSRDHILGLDPGFLLYIIGRELFSILHQFFIARAPLVDEGLVDKSLLHQHADHPPSQCAVRAGLRLQMDIRLFSHLRAANVGHDQLNAARFLCEQIAEEPMRTRP